ncbi:Cell cycle serine/threonine-protein kinase cdc5/MSD2 [Tulasnella sp. 403]|nr:Cell cycle serine/threonine-protein kinase cdc5/MSD2 [Tulasnella sp. 403]
MATVYSARSLNNAPTRRTAGYDLPPTNVAPSATTSNTVNAYRQHAQQQQQYEQYQQQKMPPPPPPKDDVQPAPLPRQNSKTVPPSPPRLIRDVQKAITFTRIGFLGEGGFARVYEVADLQGERYAIKLYAEIRLHRSLQHPNIVAFEDCFEDAENVYMTLELCPNGSLMDLIRHRKRLTEPEARFFLMQVVGACHYMHTHQVIHRDLKLGNLFLDSNMNIKVGDFGLAALIETPGERKKTICGTPNYIAPEVLFDTANGHSFEVDTWSIGVILYTLVVGKPPFQTKDVKAIYQRIRDNNYEFPSDRELSEEVQHLVSQILTHDPLQRPTLFEIVDHPFFVDGIVPSSIPKSALDHAPSFPGISRNISRNNLARLRRQCLLDEEVDSVSALSNSLSMLGVNPKNAAQAAAQQERDFLRAVQPASPISALLQSARQPLVVTNGPVPHNAPSASPHRSGSLLRKLVAVAPPQSAAAFGAPSGNGARSPTKAAPLAPLVEQEEEDALAVALAKSERNRTRELESQKARIVAQMVPDGQENGESPLLDDAERENIPPSVPQRGRDRNGREDDRARDRELDRKRKERERAVGAQPPTRTTSALDVGQPPRNVSPPATSSALPSSSTNTAPASAPKVHGFEQAGQTLADAFKLKEQGMLFRDPAEDRDLAHEKVFIVSWVDYCNKYGMGYALTDGSVGVYYNDSTTLLLAPGRKNMDYISSRRGGSVYVRKHYGTSADDYPEDLRSKVHLAKYFEDYMYDRLYGDYDYAWVDSGRTKGMEFVQKYFRMKNVIVFKLSHEVIQFNFNDHTKLILSSKGLAVSYVDKHYQLHRHTLSSLIYRAFHPSADEVQRKADEKLLNKLKYCKEVLLSIRTVSSSTNVPPTSSSTAQS